MNEATAIAAIEAIERAPGAVFDLETTGLSAFHGARIVGAGVQPVTDRGARGGARYFPFRHAGDGNLPESLLHRLLAAVWQPGKRVDGHNIARFDVQHVVQEMGWTHLLRPGHGVQVVDTMVAALLVNENSPSFKLEALAEGRGIPDPWSASHALDAELKARKLKKDGLWKIPATDPVIHNYGCADVRLAGSLREHLDVDLKAQGLDHLLPEMCEYARLLARMERDGLLIDADRMRANAKIADGIAATTLAEIQQASGNPLINPRSPKQLGAWLNMKSTAKKQLKLAGSPHAKLLCRYRCASKAGGTYYDPILSLLDADSVLHPQLNMTRDPTDRGGTRSSRLSCSNPNFQALPHTDEVYRVRECVVARPGYVFLSCDYERAEVWMAGSFSGDPLIREAYEQDIDLYARLADDLQITRQEAKIVFLAIQYGIGAGLLALNFGWTVAAAKKVIETFRRKYPRIRHAMYAHADEADANGIIRLFTGRLAHFDGKRSKPYSAWNRRIQGTVGEMMRQVMQALEGMLDVYGARMLLQVHDEILVECPVDRVRQVMPVIIAVATNYPQFALPPRMDVGIGANYEAAKG